MLVDRSRGRVHLTPAGARVLRAARSAVAEADRIPGLARPGIAPFRLGVMASAGWPLIRAARRSDGSIGGVPVELVGISLTDGFEPVLSGGVDAGVSFMPLVLDERISAHELSRAPSGVGVGDAHPVARRGACSMADLAEGPLLLPDHHPDWAVNFDVLARAHGLSTPPVIPVTNMFEAMCAAAEGLGMVISAGMADFPAWPGTTVVPMEGFEDVRTGLVWARDAPHPQLGALIRALEEAREPR